jgi:hypothetical protein
MQLKFKAIKRRIGKSSSYVIIPKGIADNMQEKEYEFEIKEVNQNDGNRTDNLQSDQSIEHQVNV